MNYFYEAVDATGSTVVGKIDAGNEQEAKRNLMLMGYRPRSLAPNLASEPESAQIRPEEKEEPSLATGHARTPDLSAVVSGIGGATSQSGSPISRMPAQAARRSAAQNFTGMHSLDGAQAVAQSGNAVRGGSITLAGNAARLGVRNTPSSTGLGTVANSNASKLGGVSTRDLMLFFQQLASLVKSGMTIYTALENLGPRTRNANLSRVASEMAAAAHRGGRVSDVMANYPRIFPDHIVGMVRAGELGGFLEISLAEIAQNYEQNIALYRGSWLPKLMAVQAFLALALVIPLFSSLFDSMDFAANIRLYFIREAFILPIFGVIYLGIRWGSRHVQLPHLRHFRDTWALRLPAFGDLTRQAALFNFVKMLRKLHNAGVAPIHAWEGAMHTSSNVVIREKLAGAYLLMQKGASLSDAFSSTGLFADNVEQLMITGQQSGEVVESLDRAADIYDERVQEARSKSRMMMLRMGVLAMLILGGGAMLWMTRSYFDAIFAFPEKMFPELNN